MIEMIKHLASRLPLDNALLKQLSFTNPSLIDEGRYPEAFVSAAKMTKRFNNDELEKLRDQLVMVKLSLNPDSDTLQFDESQDSYDSFWLKKVLSKVKKLHSGEEFKELIKVVKMISIMPNSRGFVERGFNATKLIADSRQNVSESLMTSSKVLLDHMRHVGGPSKVLISRDLLVAHKSAYQNYQTRLMKEKHEKELEARNKLKEIDAQHKKRKFEEESLQ